MSNQYEVLSPWADADPVPLKGLSPRLTDLTGKKIGLFVNSKRAARPIMEVVADRLQKRYPTAELSWYVSRVSEAVDVETTEKVRQQEFQKWVNSVDGVVLAVGD